MNEIAFCSHVVILPDALSVTVKAGMSPQITSKPKLKENSSYLDNFEELKRFGVF
jgi:hypothetical protein